jgi:hypothetical protein
VGNVTLTQGYKQIEQPPRQQRRRRVSEGLISMLNVVSKSTREKPGWIDAADTLWYSPHKTEFDISTAEQLAGLAKIVNDTDALHDPFKGKTVRLVSDIDLAGREWTPIGSSYSYSFMGTFDGGGRTIANLTIHRTEKPEESFYACVGLFGLNSGTLRNIRLTRVHVFSSYAEFYYVGGGLVGENYGKIEDCAVNGDIFSAFRSGSDSDSDSDSYTGGLAGVNNGTLTGCHASGNVSSSAHNAYAGGLVGEDSGGTITDCTTGGSISSSSVHFSAAGGLVGYVGDGGTITGCTTGGTSVGADSESGDAHRGGFIGYVDGRDSWENVTLADNRNKTGLSPAIGLDNRKRPPRPSDDI